MNRVIKTVILFSVGLFFVTAFTAYAEIPPPPVNQNLAIPDTVIGQLSEAECRVCHVNPQLGETPPTGVPVDTTYLPDRHHLVVDTPIPDNSAAPCIDESGFNTCVPGDLYECLSCHNLVFNSVTFVYELGVFRDCNFCHVQVPGEGSVHHTTPLAENGECAACHGSFVDPGLVGGVVDPANAPWLPTYGASLVTPWPSGKPNGGDGPADIKNGGDLGAGNCNFCHNTAPLGSSSFPDFVIDPASGVVVYANDVLHHSAIIDPSTTSDKCLWCHDVTAPNGEDIRRCEYCHGIPSLHNIQFGLDKSPSGPGITPGMEDAYQGHIGQQKDCWGCHGNNGVVASAPGSGPVIPSAEVLTPATFVAGVSATATLQGTSFVNSVQNPVTGAYDIKLESNIQLTDAIGNLINVDPISVTNDEITFDMPALAAGNYTLRAAKGPKVSNAIGITVIPNLQVDSASCENGELTILGQGFASYFEAENSGTNVALGGQVVAVASWTDTRIDAMGNCQDNLVLNTLYGNVSAPVEVSGGTPAVTPEITRTRPSLAVAGRNLTIYGNDFGSTKGSVSIGGTNARVIYWSDGKVKVRTDRRTDRGDQTLEVSAANGTATSSIFVR